MARVAFLPAWPAGGLRTGLGGGDQSMRFRQAWIGFWLAAASAPASDATHPAPTASVPADTVSTVLDFRCDRVALGAPVAVCLDFAGNVIVADTSPPRMVAYAVGGQTCTEFQSPVARPAFQPSDVSRC